ncbi:MAG: hypothetical protein U0T11_06900 [Chitinophagaceae bacterium]
MFRLLALFLFLSKQVISQESSDTIYIENKPVTKGYILKYKDSKYGISDPSDYISVYADNKDVFAIKTGVVKSTFKIDSENFICIESGDTLMIYGRINTQLKKGDKIYEGDKIGDLLSESQNLYMLVLAITTIREPYTLNYIELEKYITIRFGRKFKHN